MSASLLANSPNGYIPASQRMPPMAVPFVSDRAKKTLDLVEKFVEEECVPADVVFEQALGDTAQKRFSTHPQILEDLKAKAKTLGLWNLFLPKNHFAGVGAGFSNLEYGLMAEILGRSVIASEACNCSAPDTGNMEVIAKYGTEAQKKEWLTLLMDGKIRSAFLMTEPQVAASDATNMEFSMRDDGDSYVLNGQKWWGSGAGDTRCKIYILMGLTNPSSNNRYRRHSVILVPASTPGITVHRVLSVVGFDHAPEGHAHLSFHNVRVPKSNLILGENRGFEVIQGRLGPGRIHHAMRSVGQAEKALEYLVARLTDPAKRPFGQQLSSHGVQIDRVARSRIEIDAARLAVLNTAITLDNAPSNAHPAVVSRIAAVKVQVPNVLLDVLDRAMQGYGGAGVCQDTPLAAMWSAGRAMRIVDGPDEVHVMQLGRTDISRGNALRERIEAQKAKTNELFKQYGMERQDPLALNRVSGEEKAKL